MNDKINVLVASNDNDLLKLINNYLLKVPVISSVEIASDGLTAYNKITSSKPDVAVIDGILPRLDGLGLLEMLNGKSTTKIIMMSAIANENIVNTALSFGAEYYLLKPFDVDILAARIEQICEPTVENTRVEAKNICYNSEADNVEIQIANVLRSLGISQNLSGYKYNKEAIAMALEDESSLERVTKGLYPAIAKKFHTTPNRVERAIRHSIETMATKDNNSELMIKIFGGTINSNKDKPTNSHFLAAIAEYLRMNKIPKAC